MKFMKQLLLLILTSFAFIYFFQENPNRFLFSEENPGNRLKFSSLNKPLDHFSVAYISSEDSNEIIPIDITTGFEGTSVLMEDRVKILGISENGKDLYTASAGLFKIQKVDLLTRTAKDFIDLEYPLRGFLLSKDGASAYLCYEKLNGIHHLNLATQEIKEVASFTKEPNCMILDQEDQHFDVSFKGSNEIISIDLKTGQKLNSIHLDSVVEALCLSHDGKTLYAYTENDELSILDKQKQLLNVQQVAHSCDPLRKKTLKLGLNQEGTKLYIVKEQSSKLIPFNLKTLKTENSILLDHSIESIGFYPKQEVRVSFKVDQTIAGQPTYFNAVAAPAALPFEEIDYRWDFGDHLETVSQEPEIAHVYDSEGEFTATLTVSQRMDNFFSKTDIGKAAILELSSKAKKTFEIRPMAGNPGPSPQALIPSTTVGTPSQTNIIYGQSVTDMAVVTGSFGSGSPTGTVSFFVGATQIGADVTLTAGPNNTATATSVSYTPATVGNYQFTAQYNGDSTYAGSSDSSATNAFTVSQVASSTNLSTSINPSVFGESITLSATVLLNNSNALPTGTVTFMDGATTLGTSNLVSGTANFLTSSLSVGSHSLTAVYSGDVNFAGSTSNLLTQTVNKAVTTTSLVSSINPNIFGNSTTFTATISVTPGGAGTPTGIVTFIDGATTIGTGTVTSGVATLNISSLAVGSHNIKAVYGGDGNFLTSTSNIIDQVIDQGTTTSLLVSSVNPTTYGQSTTFTATVSVATGAGTPTGFFTFKNGATVLGTVNLTGNSASLAISNLAVGTNSITAVYSGDLNFSTSTSQPLAQVVSQATPIAAVVSNLNPSNFGQQVTFSATVASPTNLGLPSGTVTFLDGATPIGTVTLTPSGANTSAAILTIQTLSGGAHQITVAYSGDTNFTSVTSPAITQNVIVANTTALIFSTSPNPSEFGQPVTFQVNIVGSVSSPPAAPTGTVTFFDGATVIGTGTLSMFNSNISVATLTISSLSTGSHSISASYAGDINYTPATTSAITHGVVVASTTLTTTSSGTPSVVGQLVTFTANLNSLSPGAGTPTGSIIFYNGNQILGTAPLTATGPNSSQATFQTSALILGNHFILSTYDGDPNFAGSDAPIITQMVVPSATVSSVVSSENPSNFGDNVTFTATIAALAPGSGTPTGTVSFFDGATLLGTGTLSSGVATFSTIALFPGTHPIHVVYSGDVNYLTSTSSVLNQVVNSQLDTTTTIASSNNASAIDEAVTYTATITSITGTPTGTVSFYDNGVLIGTGTIVNGVASVTEPAGSLDTLGLHPITATYSGDANYITSQGLLSQYVVPYDTSTLLTIMPTNPTQSNAVLTATVTASGSPTPIPPLTGTVTFYQNGVAISPPVAVDPITGIATYAPNNLHFGTGPITAVYSGDTTQFAMSTSNPIEVTVQQTDMLTTETSLTASPSPAFACEPVQLTATVVTTEGFYTPTGSVTFFDGTTAIGTAVLNNAGVATVDVTTLSVGTHTLTSTYNSDSNYAFSFSNTVTQIIAANPTTMNFSLIPNQASTPYGEALNFLAQVSSPNGIPTGSVIFSNTGGELATVALDNTGLAIYTINSLTSGTDTYTATYTPDCCISSCFGASNASFSHTITPVDSNSTLTATPSPATYGDTVTLVADVSSYSIGTPTGTVTFYNGSTLIGTSPIVDGMASIEVTGLPAGIVVFNATYNGDVNFFAKNVPSTHLLINKQTAAICLITSSPNPSVYGQLVTFTATVTSLTSIPTGTITFFSGTSNLGMVTLNSGGIATLETSSLNVGTNPILAVYSGDSNFLPLISSILSQVVTKAATETQITSTVPNPSTFNTPVTVNVSVTALNPGNGIPTGTISGFYGSVALGTATLSNGVASFSTTVLPTGTPTITVVYGGDSNFTGSQGLGTHTVNTAATTIATITSSVNPSVFGQSMTFSTHVSSSAGIPTGTVNFYDGTNVLGIVPLDSNGNASLTNSNVAVGTHPITVKYNGDANFSPVTSSVLNQVVNKASTSTTLTSSLTTAAFGESITFTATTSPIAPGAGMPTGTITFKNGAVTLGTVTLSNAGTASFTTSSLPASATPYLITAVYSGDTNFNGSTSAVLDQNVIPVSTLTNAVSSPNPSTLGQLVTINVNVVPINTGLVTPSGIVTATYGSTVIGTGSLDNNGDITFLTSTLPAGNLPIIISYAGNSNFTASSTTLTQTVNQSPTTTTLASSLNPSPSGASVTFTATVTSGFGTPTGTVSFFDGSTAIGASVLNGGGIATLTTSSLTLGSHNIVAVYSSGTNFAASTSATLVQNVIAASTSTSLTSSINPTGFGQATILTATVTVTSPGFGTVNGTVTFEDGATVLGTASVSNGVALLTVSNLSVGTHTLKAVYNGNATFTGSTSPNLTQNVVLGTTNTTLTSVPNPSTFGETVVLTANVAVTVGSGSPTGTITFKDGATVIGTATLNNGQAALSISSLSLGSHSLTATYSGDANFATSTSTVTTQVVTQTTSSTLLTSSANPSVFGQTTTLTAIVPTGSAPSTPTGTVTFKDGPTIIGTATLVAGVATLNVSDLTVGSHTLTAVYGGDANFAASTSQPLTQIVNQASTSTAISSSSNPSIFGDSVTFTATVMPTSGAGVPTGTVIFKDGTTVIGSVPLVGGVATLQTSSLTTGAHSITATYNGDDDFSGSSSSPLAQIVNAGMTSTTLASSLNPSAFGQTITLTATVGVTSGIGQPTGTVTFIDGSTVIGTGTLNAGVATLSISTLSTGTHSITSVYSGDNNFNSSTSTPLSQTVDQATSTTNILTTSPNPSMFGQTVTFFAAVSTSNAGTPTGTVTFFDGANPLGTVSIFDGLAIYSTALLSVGHHPITATYNGDVNYLPSTSSPPTVQVVNQTAITATTVTTLTSIPNPSNFGQAVTFNVLVTPLVGSSVPTGIVTIYSGAIPLNTLTLDNTGRGSYTTSSLPAGVSTIVALYSGDSQFSSSSGTLAQQVIAVSTTSTLSSSANPSFFNEPVTLSSQVSSASGIPTGSVSFYDGATLLGTVALNNLGVASLTTSDLSTGSHSLNAIYNPDPNFTTSNSMLTQVVNPANTVTTILTTSPNPSNVGGSINFVAHVEALIGIPTGTISFYDGATLLGTVPTFNGLALFNSSALSAGSHSITAVYNGSPDFNGSTSVEYIQVVEPGLFSTTTALTSSLNPAPFGDLVTLNAAVSGTNGLPTGNVIFYDGSTSIGTALLVNGVAQITTSDLSVGTHTIVAVYQGDAAFAQSSANLNQQIVANTIPDAPQNFYGCRVVNKFINYDEFVNLLTWIPPQNNENIVAYEIYRNKSLTKLVATVPNKCPFQFKDGNRKKKKTYIYYIVSVNSAGVKSSAISTTVKP